MSELFKVRVERVQFAEFTIVADDERDAQSRGRTAFDRIAVKDRNHTVPKAIASPVSADPVV